MPPTHVQKELRELLGADVFAGDPVSCICNDWRHVNGHMKACPLRGWPPAVVVIDSGSDPRDDPLRSESRAINVDDLPDDIADDPIRP